MSGLQEERTIYVKRSGLAAYHILGLGNGLSVNSRPGPVLAQPFTFSNLVLRHSTPFDAACCYNTTLWTVSYSNYANWDTLYIRLYEGE